MKSPHKDEKKKKVERFSQNVNANPVDDVTRLNSINRKLSVKFDDLDRTHSNVNKSYTLNNNESPVVEEIKE